VAFFLEFIDCDLGGGGGGGGRGTVDVFGCAAAAWFSNIFAFALSIIGCSFFCMAAFFSSIDFFENAPACLESGPLPFAGPVLEGML